MRRYKIDVAIAPQHSEDSMLREGVVHCNVTAQSEKEARLYVYSRAHTDGYRVLKVLSIISRELA
jgi:hypothetical protein